MQGAVIPAAEDEDPNNMHFMNVDTFQNRGNLLNMNPHLRFTPER